MPMATYSDLSWRATAVRQTPTAELQPTTSSLSVTAEYGHEQRAAVGIGYRTYVSRGSIADSGQADIPLSDDTDLDLMATADSYPSKQIHVHHEHTATALSSTFRPARQHSSAAGRLGRWRDIQEGTLTYQSP